ncbi:CATRA system-associated protein [Nonomuraea sp. LP-02]|uniref:CATRA system-associated protein n=1 Tax=Nonomuraea sp. LP-02 TaxID=3097960 RepID=UPI002E333B9C|nr:CATRA system-associated protein [Nonomuraea sp. LP-02]MED7931848.1 CATRA system-associated protein [Nonomuraea sp. LP-02]
MPTFEETLADTDDLMTRVSAWHLSPEGWEEVAAQLGLLEAALARGDVRGARLALSRVEMAGPTLGGPRVRHDAAVDGSADSQAVPLVVNQTIERIGAFVAGEDRRPPDDDH